MTVIQTDSVGRMTEVESSELVVAPVSQQTTTRTDGLNNPLSINSGIGCTWQDVEERCEEAGAVGEYFDDGDDFVITWCDGGVSRFRDPQPALIAIREMESA